MYSYISYILIETEKLPGPINTDWRLNEVHTAATDAAVFPSRLLAAYCCQSVTESYP